MHMAIDEVWHRAYNSYINLFVGERDECDGCLLDLILSNSYTYKFYTMP
jgi:hypothetical protein